MCSGSRACWGGHCCWQECYQVQGGSYHDDGVAAGAIADEEDEDEDEDADNYDDDVEHQVDDEVEHHDDDGQVGDRVGVGCISDCCMNCAGEDTIIIIHLNNIIISYSSRIIKRQKDNH